MVRVARVLAELYGSLALTGHGHGTDRAILLGLSGEEPDLIEPETIEPKLTAIRAAKKLKLAGAKEIAFDEAADLLWHRERRWRRIRMGCDLRRLTGATRRLRRRFTFRLAGIYFARGRKRGGESC